MLEKNKILFETKTESNERRLAEALARAPHERVMFFLSLCEEMQFFKKQLQNSNFSKNNYKIE